MTQDADSTKPASQMAYVWAALIIFMMGVIMIGMILALRPSLDPLVVIAATGGMTAPLIASVLALMKSQETHLTVNSQLAKWKEEFKALMHAEGVIDGTEKEQARIAEQKRILALTTAAERSKDGRTTDPSSPPPVVVVPAAAISPIPTVTLKPLASAVPGAVPVVEAPVTVVPPQGGKG